MNQINEARDPDRLRESVADRLRHEINEALAKYDDHVAKRGYATAEDMATVADAARAYVRDWIPCPTCGGSGRWSGKVESGESGLVRCPDCVDGMIPSPESVRIAHDLLLDLVLVNSPDDPGVTEADARAFLVRLRRASKAEAEPRDASPEPGPTRKSRPRPGTPRR